LIPSLEPAVFIGRNLEPADAGQRTRIELARQETSETTLVGTMERPSVAIGHVILKVSDVARSAGFYKSLGLRSIVEREELAILLTDPDGHVLTCSRTIRKGGQSRGLAFPVVAGRVSSVRSARASRAWVRRRLTREVSGGQCDAGSRAR